jgi:hypothetical protein
MHKKIIPTLTIITFMFAAQQTYADGSTIDKVYDPYVQLLEKEFEYRVLHEQNAEAGEYEETRHKISYGQALSDRFAAEFYVIGVDGANDSFELQAYEVELKWQLTEQGEYKNDWGLLFELENERDKNIWEVSTTLIAVHEWSKWIATGNLSIIYEWGNDIDNEWESALSAQLRYRYSERLEPGIEIYQSQYTQGIGPVVNGLWRLEGGKKLNWGFGVIVGTKSDTPDVNWKFNLEYEFQ